MRFILNNVVKVDLNKLIILFFSFFFSFFSTKGEVGPPGPVGANGPPGEKVLNLFDSFAFSPEIYVLCCEESPMYIKSMMP